MNWILDALRHGSLLAFSLALMVSPLGMIALALLIERRPFRPREQYVAFLYGDVALAASIGAGGTAWPHESEPASLRTLATILLVLALVFGVSQWRHDVTSGRYTQGQALSPTKIWHQVVAIPLLTTWLMASLWAVARNGSLGPIVMWLAGALVWTVCAVYDERHPKPGHAEFAWSRAGRGRLAWDEEQGGRHE